jgi:TPR repeat protein
MAAKGPRTEFAGRRRGSTFGRRRLALFGIVLLALALGERAALAASDRAAVVIGNADYAAGSLQSAVSDARIVSTTLRELGFDVLLVENLNSSNLRRLPDFARDHLASTKVALVYYNGYVAPAGSENLLLPVDVANTSDASVRSAGLGLSKLIDATVTSSAGPAIVIVDAAPLPQSVTRNQPERLAPIDNKNPALMVALSSSPEFPTVRQVSGAGGTYATVLANALSVPAASVHEIFRDVRRSVREATDGQELPIVIGGAAIDLVLQRAAPPEDAPAAAKPELDQILWHFIKNTAVEADLDLFTRVFPTSTFVERAQARRARLLALSEPEIGTLTRSLASSNAPPASAPGADYVLGTTGDRSPPKPLRTWPAQLPATPEGLARLVTPCDELAADPDDPMRVTPGVNWSLVDRRAATRACVTELARKPDDKRLQFELGRVLDIAGMYEAAEYYYKQAADQLYSAAIANRAYMYMTGRGHSVDWGEALRLLRLGAELGNPRSRTDLGVAYLRGSGVPSSPKEALLWLRLAGSNGWPNSIDVLGGMYAEGKGVPKDDVQAAELYAAAAAVGNTNAMVNLARAYLDGRGVERNASTGRYWLEKSSAAGNPFAPFFLGELAAGANNPSAAIELFNLSASRSFGQARYELGQIYEKGAGVKQDLPAAAFNYALADRQTFETPVSADIIEAAKSRLADIRSRLTPAQRDAVEKRVREWIELNGS